MPTRQTESFLTPQASKINTKACLGHAPPEPKNWGPVGPHVAHVALRATEASIAWHLTCGLLGGQIVPKVAEGALWLSGKPNLP